MLISFPPSYIICPPLFIPPLAVQESSIICIYCLETRSYLRVDQHGHLLADGKKIASDCMFEVKKKGDRIGLKSVKYKNKLVSKAMTSSVFHFHRLQVL